LNLYSEILQIPFADQLDGQERSVVLQNGYLAFAKLQKITESAVKTYAATISQTGTDDPTSNLLANTVGQPTWTRIDANNYELYLYAAFPQDRTIFNKGVDTDGNYLSWVDINRLNLYVAGGDDTITNYPIKVEVYWYLLTPYPENFFASNGVFPDEINLAWDAVPGIDAYVLERCQDQASWEEIYTGTGVMYGDSGLDLTSLYFYRIKATKAGDLDSDYSYTELATV
jgi:hypothetical protein